MVVQTTGYFNLSILFYWGLVFLFKIFFGGGNFFFFQFSCVSLSSVWFALQVGQKCKFFQWHDDEICEHDKVLIPEQRQQIITLEAEVASCCKRENFYTVALAFLLVICGICPYNCMFG